MVLSPGARLGPYEILAGIGAGGMGEVYRARDAKLGRDVALKILPELLATDPDRLARFKREAQVLASLNHPNIAQIHGLEDSSPTHALVLELVEGPTLAELLQAQGPGPGACGLPLSDALPIARQIAEALEAAHEQGVIHRDLKPANVKVRDDGTVKVLDFGLAKALDPAATSTANAANSPTLTARATQIGVILGTAAYMSPEQARGRTVDRRADIWAFGAVLYEMLTGRRAFAGEDVSITLAAVLKDDVHWHALPAGLPASIGRLLKRCLEKDPKRRLQAIGEARVQIEDLLSGAAPEPAAAPATPALPASHAPVGRHRLWLTALAALAAGGLITAAVAWAMMHWTPAAPPQTMRFVIVPAAGQAIAPSISDRQIAISPDGTRLAYISGAGGAGGGELIVRAIDRIDAEPLRGISGARAPFFSTDGQWIAFFQSGLKKVSVTGGPPVSICPISGAPRGGSWGPDDTIVFATSAAGGLQRVAVGGGTPKAITKPDVTHGEFNHLFPSVLPGGRAVLFTISAGPSSESQVAILDLETGQQKTLIRGGSHAEFIEPINSAQGSPGYLVYAVAGTLRAVRFDPKRYEVLGEPVPVVDQVAMVSAGTAEYSVSRAGALVYLPGGSLGTGGRSLVWKNRQGREEPINAPIRSYYNLRLSPDGTRLALDIRDQENDVWIWDLARRTPTRLTLDSNLDGHPVWTPDSRRVIFSSARAGVLNLYRQSADGTGTVERLSTSPTAQYPTAVVSGDNGLLVSETSTGGTDISLLPMGGKSSTTRVFQPASFTRRNAEVSPDGRWLAYESLESAQPQIYVQPFPNVNGGRWTISTAGGTKPVWSPIGRELFYIDGTNFLTAVPYETTPTFRPGNPTKLFEARNVSGVSAGRFYDVSRDGQRFVLIKEAVDQPSKPAQANIVVVLNWVEELKTKLGVK